MVELKQKGASLNVKPNKDLCFNINLEQLAYVIFSNVKLKKTMQVELNSNLHKEDFKKQYGKQIAFWHFTGTLCFQSKCANI